MEKNSEVSDPVNEESWDDFSRMLWNLVNEIDVSTIEIPDTELPESVEDSGNTEDFVSPENARKKDCFSFEKCSALAEKSIILSVAENAHLENCQYCENRVEAFSEFFPAEENIELSEIIPVIIETPQKNRLTEFFQKVKSSFRQNNPSLLFGFASLLIILAFGLIYLLLQSDRNNENKNISSVEKTPLENSPDSGINKQIQENSGKQISPEDKPANTETTMNAKSPDKKVVNLPKNSKPDNNSGKIQNPNNLPIELAFLSSDERESLRTGKIKPSEDLALLRETPTRRGNQDITMQLISPKNEATLEKRPVLRWQNIEISEYRVIILDQGLNEVAESEILSQNSWQISKEIPAGFYFWQVLVRKQNSDKFISSGNQAFFKIVGEMEKKRIKKAKNAAKSNLVSAILYARAGLFAEAEVELNTELQKNPKSLKAQKMLNQVRQWKLK